VKILRLLTIALLVFALPACSWFKRGPKSSAHMYDGDESPHLRMYDEGPGSPLHN
jgi:hypothetical protein